jgi:hypothetical protein
MSQRARINITDLPWTDIVEQIAVGECTPFIGAGACAGILPLAEALGRTLIAEDEVTTGRRCPLPNPGDLARACQYLAVTHKDSKYPKRRIAQLLKGQPRAATAPDEIHTVLASLPLPMYLTTNYDDFMITALRRRQPEAKREFARWQKSLLEDEPSAFDVGYKPTAESPVVFHLHGHADHYAAMVATEDDYVDFLVNISKDLAHSPAGNERERRAMLPLPVRRAITNNRLLFVGYGLADINFRVILRGLVGSLERSQKVVSLAIQYSEGNPRELEEYLEEYFEWTLDLQVFWGSAQDFATELNNRWLQSRKA